MKKILPTIVVAQFLCTSLWFAANAVMPEIINNLHLEADFFADVTSAIQLGFIIGTLTFAILSIADRFSPARVFFISAVLASIFNLSLLWTLDPFALLFFRFLTGFFLAGIYPVGMKIAADYFDKGLGASLGFLVGALVLGTAFPHLLKSWSAQMDWHWVIMATSALAIIGGLMMFILVPDGPYRKKGQQVKLNSFLQVFKSKPFRSVAFGYFGHMWELYTFWAFVPFMLNAYQNFYPLAKLNIPLWSFIIIAAGSLACISSGILSQFFDTKKVATWSLILSGLCCLVSPFFLMSASVITFLIFLFFWGWVVIADSPLFSTLVAKHAPQNIRGTALTIVNCIGFSITIFSIQLLNFLTLHISTPYLFLILAIGPIFGIVSLISKTNKTSIS